jgi:hypothetical protein
MREQPTAAELIEIVAEFLREQVMPELAGRTAFHTRVAATVLDIVRREFLQSPAALEAEGERLRDLLGRDGDAATLNRDLCERLADGEIDLQAPQLLRHLWATTLATVAIDQPSYATYRRAVAEAPGDA